MPPVFGLKTIIKQLLDDGAAAPTGKDKAGDADRPKSTKEQLSEENRERRKKGETHLKSFASERLAKHQDESIAQAVEEKEGEDDSIDRDVKEEMRLLIDKVWSKCDQDVNAGAPSEIELAKRSQDHIWAIYTRETKPDNLQQLLTAYLMAGIAFEANRHKVEEGEFFRYFFRKVAHLVVKYRDKYGNTLIHYVLKRDRQNAHRVLNALEAMAMAAKARMATEAGKQGVDERDAVKDYFTEQQNKARETIRAVFELGAQRSQIARFDKLMAEMYEEPPRDPSHSATMADEDPEGLKTIQRGEDKAFTPEVLEQLIKDGKMEAAAIYARVKADELSPEEIDALAEKTGFDIFQVELTDTDPEKSRPMRNASAAIPGALVNHYAKNGVFNLDYARRRLVKVDGAKSQGRKDERGYNVYMRIAETRRISDAYLRNEHEFWEFMFDHLAKNAYKNAKQGASFRRIRLNIVRDILDMPGEDGRTALHVAAINNNVEVVKFYLRNVLDFTHADLFKRAQGRNMAGAKIQELRKFHLVEMRENLGYLMSADNTGYNAWMYAMMHDRKDVLLSLLGAIERHPEYLDVISSLTLYPADEIPVPFPRFTERAFDESGSANETCRYMQGVLRDVEKRRKWKQEAGRGVGGIV